MTTSYGTHEDLPEPSSKKPQQRNSSLPSFLIQVDSDDDENSFQPPALSDYGLALLKKDQQDKENIPPDVKKDNQNNSIPKRVNFTKSPSIDKTSSAPAQYHTTNITSHTNQSEYETIFTKNIKDFESYSSSSPLLNNNDRSQRTPLTKLENSNNPTNNDSSTTNGSNLRNTSVRRARMFGSLGPPKRASFSPIDKEEAQKPQHHESPHQPTGQPETEPEPEPRLDIEDTPMKDAQTPPKLMNQSTPFKESKTTTTKETKIEFEGLNPYQYARKYKLPSNELPKLVRLYFEQQEENRESLQSPVKLRATMYNQIQEEIRNNNSPRKYSPKPKKELFKEEKETKSLEIYSDKEVHRSNLKNCNYDLKFKRQPLSQLNENRNQLPLSSRSSLSQKSSELYQERYHKHTEPLKEPDYQSIRQNSRILTVNDKQYEKLELLGKGGSSKVFKVKSLKNKVYAVKKIVFDEFDDSSIKGFKGEIDLLIKLRNQERVVRLVDYSLGQGSLLLVMECGDIDLSHVLSKRLDMPMDVEFVRYHASEMLKCVKAVHDAGIVHSDLKPANFLFVKGVLKIIDFGIANAVPEHTVNIYRESQIGTPNYMAPEALIDNNQQGLQQRDHKSTWRVGKPSDIWSCGCIIYQMIYGRPPYGGYQGSQRLLAIMNPDVKIMYPEKGLGGIKVPGTALETIKNCLDRDPNKRWKVDDILNGSFLKPRIVSESFINDLVKNAITYGISKNSIDDEELKNLADDVWRRVSQLSL